MMPSIAGLRIYPVKSLPGCIVSNVRVQSQGALQHDRRWAFVDQAGQFWNTKRTPALLGCACEFDPSAQSLRISHREHGAVDWCVGESTVELEALVSNIVGAPAFLQEDCNSGFPDDVENPGPTLVTTASLEQFASWFPGLTTEEMRQRLRANVEIGDAPPCWEDLLLGPAGTVRPVQLGCVIFDAANPCQRCTVPSRDPQSGQVWPGFAREFARQRELSLPRDVERSRFTHYYRATVNTRLLEFSDGEIRVGDPVSVPTWDQVRGTNST